MGKPVKFTFSRLQRNPAGPWEFQIFPKHHLFSSGECVKHFLTQAKSEKRQEIWISHVNSNADKAVRALRVLELISKTKNVIGARGHSVVKGKMPKNHPPPLL